MLFSCLILSKEYSFSVFHCVEFLRKFCMISLLFYVYLVVSIAYPLSFTFIAVVRYWLIGFKCSEDESIANHDVYISIYWTEYTLHRKVKVIAKVAKIRRWKMVLFHQNRWILKPYALILLYMWYDTIGWDSYISDYVRRFEIHGWYWIHWRC